MSKFKVGDLVEFSGPFQFTAPMLIIKKGVYIGNRDIKVLCSDGNIKMADSLELEVVNEGG